MRRFIVHVKGFYPNADSKEADLAIGHDWQMTKEEYLTFVQELKKIAGLDDLLKTISASCEKCRSFILPVEQLYRALEMLRNHDELSSLASELCDLLTERAENLKWDDEQWNAFLNGKLNHKRFISRGDGSLETDSDGSYLCFRYDECAFILNSSCSCFSVMKGADLMSEASEVEIKMK